MILNPFHFLDSLFSSRIAYTEEEKEVNARKKRENELNVPKKRIRVTALTIILIGMYTAFIFLLPFHRDSISFWVRYCITMLEIPMISVSAWSLTREGRVSMSKFYKTPAQRVLIFFLPCHMFFNFLMMTLLVDLPWNYAVLLDVLILGAIGVLWLINDSNSAAIKQQDRVQKKDTAIMLKLQHLSSSLPHLTEDSDIKEALEHLENSILYSDPVGTQKTIDAEEKLLQQITNLEAALTGLKTLPASNTAGIKSMKKAILEQCRTIQFILDQRNSVCIGSK